MKNPMKNLMRRSRETAVNQPLPDEVIRFVRPCIVTAITVVMTLMFSMTAYAGAVPAGTDPVAVVNNLSTFIFGLIRAIGMIMLGFGIVQVGLSLKSHDASQRANGFLTLLGGVIIAFTQEILTLITS